MSNLIEFKVDKVTNHKNSVITSQHTYKSDFSHIAKGYFPCTNNA